jgi:hypothetical protein
VQCVVIGHFYKCHPSHEAADDSQKRKEVENTDSDFGCVGAERWRTRITGLWNCIIVTAELEKLLKM